MTGPTPAPPPAHLHDGKLFCRRAGQARPRQSNGNRVSKSQKVNVVDGYTALKAAQHAARPRDKAEPTPSSPAAPAENQPPSDLQKLGAHITRTAVPAKRVIECYECGYKFQLHGKSATINCNKCRAMLDISDHVIDQKWNSSFKTAGTIHIAAGGVVETGELLGNDIILEGVLEAGTVRALRKIELRPGARFSEQNIQAPDLVIATGATIAFIDPAEFRDVEIFGALRANLSVTGIVTIHAAGSFEGELHSAHLIVEDGGGLIADLRVFK